MAASVCASEDELEPDRITAIVRVAAAEAGLQDLKPEQMQAHLRIHRRSSYFRVASYWLR